MSTLLQKISTVRNRFLFALDGIFLLASPIVAMILRLDDMERLFYFAPPLARYIVITLFIKLFVFVRTGLYRRYWRYASVEEVVLILKAVVVAWLTTLLVFFSLHSTFLNLPRSLPFIDALLTLALVAAPRLSLRLMGSYHTTTNKRVKRVLIVGAGDAGQMLSREIRKNPNLGYELLGFVDDDTTKHGLETRGVTILGGRDRIPELVRRLQVEEVIIAMPSAPGSTIRQIIEICQQADVPTRTVPGLHEMLNGKAPLVRLRPVQINDLLRRAPIETDITAVKSYLQGKRVLITGAGGSIGSELCRQIWRCHPAQMVLLGHGENSVFEIACELGAQVKGASEQVGATTLIPVIADIRFPDRIQAVFQRYQPQVVFHAAAHKHVPLMEANPGEAITNNVLGTHNVLKASVATDVERFVFISTDKAVNPTSIMGASKRAAELLVHQMALQSGKPYVAVRFGNVLGSRGSVVRTFQRQIEAGGPVTVTHPDVRRYFMTIPEAVQLVLQASVLGHGGEVFVLDMGQPIKIADLARDMIQLSGFHVDEDISIEYTGLRKGEKMYEELFVPGERYERTAHNKIFISANASAFIPRDLDRAIRKMQEAAFEDDREAILQCLQALIPEFRPRSNGVN